MRMITLLIGFPGIARARRWIALPLAEQKLLLLAGVVVAHVRVTLWMLPSRISLRLVRGIAEPHAGRLSITRPAAEDVTRAIEAVSRRIPQATCLTQAVAAQFLLRRYGYASRLCLGVTRSAQGAFAAHAWIEHDGHVVLGGAQSAGFTLLRASTAGSRLEAGIGRP